MSGPDGLSRWCIDFAEDLDHDLKAIAADLRDWSDTEAQQLEERVIPACVDLGLRFLLAKTPNRTVAVLLARRRAFCFFFSIYRRYFAPIAIRREYCRLSRQGYTGEQQMIAFLKFMRASDVGHRTAQETVEFYKLPALKRSEAGRVNALFHEYWIRATAIST